MQVQSPQQTQNQFILPGASIDLPEDPSNCKIQRTHLTFSDNKLGTNFAGHLMKKQLMDNKTVFGLLHNSNKYFPQVGDYVIGVVRFRTQEFYNLDINSSHEGVLGALDFNGATKRNRPNLQIGSCVFCQVAQAPRFLNPKLTCITAEKKQWTTGETKLAQLKKGNLVYLPSSKFSYLEKILPILSKFVSFEVALGKNGVVWLNSHKLKNLVVLSNLIDSVNSGTLQEMVPLFGDLFEK